MQAFRQALEDFLRSNPDLPDVLVLGIGIWSLVLKPDQEKAIDEYRQGLRRLKPVRSIFG
jgi:hypothetical protein